MNLGAVAGAGSSQDRGGGFDRSRVGLLATICAVAAFGCSEELAGPRVPTASVAGRVRLGSTPVSGGWVEFLPVEGAVGSLRSAPLDRDGRFQLRGVAIGKNLVRLVHPRTPGVEMAFQRFTSPLRVDVADGLEVDLDLNRERLRLIRDRAGEASRGTSMSESSRNERPQQAVRAGLRASAERGSECRVKCPRAAARLSANA